MKTTKILTILVLRSELLRRVALVVALGLILFQARVSEAAEMGTAFTYQGHLYNANYPADGLYDFQFKLYDSSDPVRGIQVGNDVNKPDVDVFDAYFTVELDFGGAVFDGNAVWLEIGVRPGEMNDPNGYTPLSPLQEVTPTPYALHTPGLLVDTALDNVFVGEGAGASNTTGRWNTFSGSGAGSFNTTGSGNTFLGSDAGSSNTTGYLNTFLGRGAGYSNTTGFRNTFLGPDAGFSNTTGNYNTAMGYRAGYSNSTGSGNVFLGYKAGYNETGDNKLYIANSDVDPPLIYGNFYTGQVGIGTTSPGAKLEVNGQVKITGGSPGIGKVLTSDASGLASWQTPAGDITAVNAGTGLNGGGTWGNVTLNVDVPLELSGSPSFGVIRGINTGNGTGVWGEGAAAGVYGRGDTYGVFGRSTSGVGVEGTSDSGYAGYFVGPKNYFSGNVGIGTNSPQGALDVASTTGAFIVPRMTTAQRDALTAVNGMIIYNTTTNQFNFYENGSWVTK